MEIRPWPRLRPCSPISKAAEGAICCLVRDGAVAPGTAHEVVAGDHITATVDMYKSIHSLITDVFGPLGVKSTFVDVTDLEAVAATLRENKSRALLVETISNPLLRVADIAALAEICRRPTQR